MEPLTASPPLQPASVSPHPTPPRPASGVSPRTAVPFAPTRSSGQEAPGRAWRETQDGGLGAAPSQGLTQVSSAAPGLGGPHPSSSSYCRAPHEVLPTPLTPPPAGAPRDPLARPRAPVSGPASRSLPRRAAKALCTPLFVGTAVPSGAGGCPPPPHSCVSPEGGQGGRWVPAVAQPREPACLQSAGRGWGGAVSGGHPSPRPWDAHACLLGQHTGVLSATRPHLKPRLTQGLAVPDLGCDEPHLLVSTLGQGAQPGQRSPEPTDPRPGPARPRATAPGRRSLPAHVRRSSPSTRKTPGRENG